MQTTTADSEKAFGLMYELFKAKPWLNSAGIMSEKDHPFEEEALAFLLTLETADGWRGCSEPARRVANSLLLDFIVKLRGPFSRRRWTIPADLPPWRQAALIIRAEIAESHPHFSKTH